MQAVVTKNLMLGEKSSHGSMKQLGKYPFWKMFL